MNFTGCNELTSVIFCRGARITSLDLSAYPKINEFHCNVGRSLKYVDLSGCTAIEALGDFDSTIDCCKNAEVKLGKNIKGIREDAFGESYDYICKKVLVPNETIKQLVKASNYPEDRIEMYH